MKRTFAMFRAVVAMGIAWALMPVAAWGQEEGKPLGVAPVDAATLARATERGRAVVKGAKWMYPGAARLVAVGGNRVFVVKGTPSVGVIGGDPRMAALDAATGKQVGADMAFAPGSSSIMAGQRMALPPAPAGRVRIVYTEQERLVDVGESAAGLELLDETPSTGDATPKVVLVSGTDKAAKWEVDAAEYHLLPAFTGDRVIMGGELYYFLRGGNFAGSNVREAKAIAIRSFERATGNLQWMWPLPADTRQTSRPVVSGENVYLTFNHMMAERREEVVGSSLAGLVMATGKEAWPAITINATVSPPVVSGGNVMVVMDAGQVLAFDAATGTKAWEATISPGNDAAKSRVTRMRSPIESFTVTGLLPSPAVDGERIYVSVSGVTDPPSTRTSDIYRDLSIGGVAAFDARTGKQEWFFRSMPVPAGAPTNPSWESKELHWSDLQVAGDHVVGTVLLWNVSRSLPMGLGSIDRKTGALEWFIPTAIRGLTVMTDRPIVSGGVVYFRIPPQTEGMEAGLYALEVGGGGAKRE